MQRPTSRQEFPRNGTPGQRHRRGAMVVLVAVVLIIMFIGAALAIDVAYMHLARAELRTATDAAARAGAEALGRLQDRDAATQAAIRVAAANEVAGQPLILTPGDIQFGSNSRSGSDRFQFHAGTGSTNSIRVLGRRTADSASGAVPLFFAPLLGTDGFEPVQASTATLSLREIALVLDVSGSMGLESDGETRLAALKRAVSRFLDEIERVSPGAQVSLTTYSTSANQIIELTDDFEHIRETVNDLRAGGRTAIGDALSVGSDSLVEDARVRPFADKSIVVMTDGNHNEGPSPDSTVSTAIARNQIVHTITFSDGANKALMRRVARRGKGIHVHADDNDDLTRAFEEIAQALAVILIE